MKLTALLIVIGVLQVSAGEAQKVTLHEKNVSLSKIFKEIRRQTGYDFFVDAELVRRVGSVSVDVSDVPLKEALDNCFKNTSLTFRIENGTILVDEDKPVFIVGRVPDSTAVLGPQKDSLVLIRGKVTDQKGNALAGVTITLKDYNRAMTTNAGGEYIFLAPNHRTLIFTSVGYRRREVKVNGAAIINISLDLDITELDATQVIAYGTTTRRFNTGEQTTVTSKEIENYPVANVLTALQGKVPGVVITQTSGVPGSPVSVTIRGQNGLNTGSNPLYIVDGVPYTMDEYLTQNSNIAHGGLYGQNPLNFINPLDIESVDILKDADATAIYGSRGANGVMLITTKKGRSGATRVTLNAFTGISQVPYLPHMLNTQQYLQMRHEAKKNDGLPVTILDYDINGVWDTTRNTNWAKELLGNGQTTNAQVSVSGGGPNSTFLLSGNYRRQNNLEKLFGGSDQTASLHFSAGTTSQDGKFSVSLTGGYTYDVSDIPPGDQFANIITLAPDAPKLFNSDGSLNFQNNTFNGNPAINARHLNRTSVNNVLSSAVISYRPLPGLELKATVGYNKQQMNEFNGFPISGNPPALGITTGSANFTTDNNTYWSVEPQATYTRDISKGRLTATVGYSVQKQTEDQLPLTATGYTSDALVSSPTAGTSIKPLQGQSYSLTVYKFTGVFGRVNYIWDNKYLLNLTGRNDGSTKFGPDNRFHFFGAVGAGWIFTEERLMKGLPWFNYGKLRASYGVTGNDQIGTSYYLANFNSTGTSYQNVPAVTPTNIPNPVISWETTRKIEVALDLHFLHDRISLTGNYFRNRNSNLLSGYAQPWITGFNQVERNLPGLVQNRGFDLTLTTVNLQLKDFSWTTTVLFTKMRNQVLRFPPSSPAAQIAANLAVGYPVGVLRLLKSAGVNPTTGLYQYYDATGHINPNLNQPQDNVVLEDPNPKWFGSIANTFTYKGFSLDVLFRVVRQIGRSALTQASYVAPPGFASNVTTATLSRWQKPGDVTDVQRYSASFLSFTPYLYLGNSTAGWSDATYGRLQNASLRYTFGNTVTKKLHVQNLQVYVLGENLLTITSYGGFDPETQSLYHLPLVRTITGGLQVTF